MHAPLPCLAVAQGARAAWCVEPFENPQII